MYDLSRRVYDVVEEIVPHFGEEATTKIGNRLGHATVFYARKIILKI